MQGLEYRVYVYLGYRDSSQWIINSKMSALNKKNEYKNCYILREGTNRRDYQHIRENVTDHIMEEYTELPQH